MAHELGQIDQNMKTDTNTKTDGLLDWAETLLCNAVPPAHCSEEEWRKLLKEWRDAKHGIESDKPEDHWTAEHPIIVRLSEVGYKAARLREALAEALELTDARDGDVDEAWYEKRNRLHKILRSA